MRNTLEYPITLDECIRAVRRAHEEERNRMASEDNLRFGDVHLMALEQAAIRLQRLQFAVKDILE